MYLLLRIFYILFFHLDISANADAPTTIANGVNVSMLRGPDDSIAICKWYELFILHVLYQINIQ